MLSAAVMRHRIDCSNIEHAIPNFDGEDRSHGVRDFSRIFEDIMEMVKADETFKLLAPKYIKDVEDENESRFSDSSKRRLG